MHIFRLRAAVPLALAALTLPTAAAAAPSRAHARHGSSTARNRHHKNASHHKQSSNSGSPLKEIESILQIKGSSSSGVLSFPFDRSDITGVTLHGVPIKPGFEINGEFDFQPIGKVSTSRTVTSR